MANDSVINWQRNRLEGWVIDSTAVSFKFDTLLAINSTNDKLIMAHLGQELTKKEKLDGIGYFYGLKIKGRWYFFSGATMYLPRIDLTKPTSFDTLHQIALDKVFQGYLMQDEKGKWQINDEFFGRFYERDAYNFPFTTQASWEASWLKLMRENWEHRDNESDK
jgi:hypothetical protein